MKKISFMQYVEEECERQWNECQATEGYGKWHEQADDTKADFYNSMYEDLVNKYDPDEINDVYPPMKKN